MSGFVYNENGVCTLPNQCGQDIRNGTKEGKRKIVKPGVKCPGDNEKYSTCGNLCEDFCEPKFDVDNCPMTCETGCFCKKGYKRNAADQCVLIEKCNEKPVCGKISFSIDFFLILIIITQPIMRPILIVAQTVPSGAETLERIGSAHSSVRRVVFVRMDSLEMTMESAFLGESV